MLLTSETDPDDIEYALRTAELARTILLGTPVQKVMLLLDTCYSGKGGNELAAAALAQMERDWELNRGGLVVVTSALPDQQAEAAAFPTLLSSAISALDLPGWRDDAIDIGAIVGAMNDDERRPRFQNIGWTSCGSTGPLPAFVPIAHQTTEVVSDDWRYLPIAPAPNDMYDMLARFCGALLSGKCTDSEQIVSWRSVRGMLRDWEQSVEGRDAPLTLSLIGIPRICGMYLNGLHLGALIMERCKFVGHVSIEDVAVSERVSFVESIFACPVSFAGSVFRGPASFRQTIFQETPDFVSARFERDVSFVDAVLEQGVCFSRDYGDGEPTRFSSITTLTHSTYGESVDMEGCLFRGPVYFDRISALKELNLSHVHFLHNADFSGGECLEQVDLSHAHVHRSLNLANLKSDVVANDIVIRPGSSMRGLREVATGPIRTPNEAPCWCWNDAREVVL